MYIHISVYIKNTVFKYTNMNFTFFFILYTKLVLYKLTRFSQITTLIQRKNTNYATFCRSWRGKKYIIPRGLKCIVLYELTRFFQRTSIFLRFIGILLYYNLHFRRIVFIPSEIEPTCQNHQSGPNSFLVRRNHLIYILR